MGKVFMKYHVEFDLDLRKNPYPGKYIALEGIDGSGKTTQVQMLVDYFRKQGKNVIQTREPRKIGLIGEIVHKVLKKEVKFSDLALQYLFATDRVLSQDEVIIPALKRGDIVISDRCFWSAIVYGVLDRTGWNYDPKSTSFLLIVYSILSMYHQFVTPDYTFYLDISLETSLKRLREKEDTKEIYEDEEKLKKVIDGYDWLSKNFAKEMIPVNGEKFADGVFKEIISKIKI
jgi:dTMP kinase